ncbi:MAG: NAD-dependent epimerase/dehydratase family protein [Acidimicrobiales bacterium]
MATRDGQARAMARVVVTGAASPLGRRVLTALSARPDVAEVVALDLLAARVHGASGRQLDLATTDLAASFDRADSVIHLASVYGPALEGAEIDHAVDVTMARRVLDAADRAGADRVVVLSSAAVYGPWANNAVPLTEEAPLRPHPDLAFAVQKAEVERLASEWRVTHPDATVALLRPAPVVRDGHGGWLARALHAAHDVPTGDDVAAQYLHVDDLASAVVAAWEHRLDGPVNVAPDRWLTPTERRALDPVPRLRLPEPVALKVAAWRWRWRLAPVPPGILPYARHPWVVANDRLVATGWQARNSNEEAYVAGHPARAIETISPQRRQELALGAAGVVVAGIVAGAVALVRRRRRRPSQ